MKDVLQRDVECNKEMFKKKKKKKGNISDGFLEFLPVGIVISRRVFYRDADPFKNI